MVPAHGVTTILYLLEKARDAAFAREGIENVSLPSSPSLRSTAMLCDGRSRSPGLTSRMPSARPPLRPAVATAS